jgi:hypothetical protein
MVTGLKGVSGTASAVPAVDGEMTRAKLPPDRQLDHLQDTRRLLLFDRPPL